MEPDKKIAEEYLQLLHEGTELTKLFDDGQELHPMNMGSRYQSWYTKAIKLVRILAPDRIDEFCSYYMPDPKRKTINSSTYVIQDYLQGVVAEVDIFDKPAWDIRYILVLRLVSQVDIMSSLISRIIGVLADVKGHLILLHDMV